MKLFLYNTLTRKKEEFKPIRKNQIGLYYCGPTVYWTQHIGNLRGATCVDVVVRTVRYLGYNVKYVRNYTDVGHMTSDADIGIDKMEKAAKRDKITPQEIAQKYIKIYETDTKELNLLDPTIKPKATSHIKEMIKMVEILLKKEYAYVTDLAIYFDTSKFKNYTKLSGQKLEKNIKGAGSGTVSDPDKKQSEDFVLWFFRAGAHINAIQHWPSPFDSPFVKNGDGFPGWHIECSAMSKKHLGNTIDLHLGGIEHIPVHHTNEIAQSESANGVRFVNYWLHNEHLLVNGKKMAKSEGTGYSLTEIKSKGYSPLVLRYLFLQAHYRSKLNFTWKAIDAAKNGLNSLYKKMSELGNNAKSKKIINKKFQDKFIKALSDDFNTPQALAIMQELLKSNLTDEEKLGTVLDFDKIFCLDLKQSLNKKENKLPQYIKDLLKQRKKAKDIKDWERSDELRDIIENKGYIVDDIANGVKITKK